MRTSGMTLLPLLVMALATGTSLQAQQGNTVITEKELAQAAANMTTAYDAVRLLRPRWLERHEMRIPGARSEAVRDAPVHIYLNGMDQGTADFLQSIRIAAVEELRWLSETETAGRYGPTPGGAAIVVTLKP